MENGQYTEENSRFASLVQGDPNEIHQNDRFGKIIAPGLMQLLGFVVMNKWRSGHKIEISLEKPVVVPNTDIKYKIFGNEDRRYNVLSDNSKTFARARIEESGFPLLPEAYPNRYGYSLTDKSVSPEDLKNWEEYSEIPIDLVSRVVPRADYFDLDKIAAVGVSVNALARELSNNPGLLPDIFFPKVRENGEKAVLEEKLCLYMGNNPEKRIDQFELNVHHLRDNPDNKRGSIVTVSETSGLYALEFYLTKVPVRTLPRLLKGV